MQDVISGANVLAMFMMGAMTASMVTLTTPLKISSVVIQEKLDGIFPGHLSSGSPVSDLLFSQT